MQRSRGGYGQHSARRAQRDALRCRARAAEASGTPAITEQAALAAAPRSLRRVCRAARRARTAQACARDATRGSGAEAAAEARSVQTETELSQGSQPPAAVARRARTTALLAPAVMVENAIVNGVGRALFGGAQYRLRKRHHRFGGSTIKLALCVATRAPRRE